MHDPDVECDADDDDYYLRVITAPPTILVFVITAFYDMTYIYSFLLVVSINYLATSNNTTQKVMELIIYVRPI